ncbi:hypothetical protein VOLCADRAFT_105670 [Volvox carteri f. nagariensis]|uniref:peptidylprolyl isomerase n=1 Tax=Volvox carteri f. nagariensis TaxID=3068 RepID=D8U298_VOLCA|nr:uncharacterized protein VOLCADRAFT_105670 [Volvox carteri f. nagariensis]EFJ46093.1 hypothetical protein VOLCADRAFT_105670 [Volvox carteri f. nagariensis]|eukprot:XP_002952843.1 hypothetical protein VOLCADRAFT_105670 [Volvox carteri f. nagariensis]
MCWKGMPYSPSRLSSCRLAAVKAHRAPARLLATRVRASGRSHAEPSSESEMHHEVGRRELLIAAAATLPAMSSMSAFPAVAAEAGDLNESASGLKWKDVQEGTGPSPVKGAVIKCHYTGRLTNGTVFDSSYNRRQPLSFTIGVGQVIKGWDMGILGAEDIPAMKEGGKRLLVIPPDLGYGARGAGGVIPPNATLEFDVELLPRK